MVRKSRSLFLSCVLVVYAGNVLAAKGVAVRARTEATEASAAALRWEVLVPPSGSSTDQLQVVNRCRMLHSFAIENDRAPFTAIDAGTRVVAVAPRSSSSVAVTFNAPETSYGSGEIVIRCIDCETEPGCKLDHQIVDVTVVVHDDQPQLAKGCGWFRQIFGRCGEKPVALYETGCGGNPDCFKYNVGVAHSWLWGDRVRCRDKNHVLIPCP